MITGILAGLFLIAIYCSAGNGEWGSVAVGAVVVVLLLALGSAGRKCNRAYGNFVDYWADSERDRRRHG